MLQVRTGRRSADAKLLAAFVQRLALHEEVRQARLGGSQAVELPQLGLCSLHLKFRIQNKDEC